MELFTYDFCKELLVYTGTGILIGGCVLWYLYIITQIVVKAVKLIIRFVKWVKARRHPAEAIQSTDSD